MHRRAQRGKVQSVYDAKRATRAPAINYKITIATTLGHTGTNKLWALASADVLRPMAIGHPITRPHGRGCIGVYPHHENNQQWLD